MGGLVSRAERERSPLHRQTGPIVNHELWQSTGYRLIPSVNSTSSLSFSIYTGFPRLYFPPPLHVLFQPFDWGFLRNKFKIWYDGTSVFCSILCLLSDSWRKFPLSTRLTLTTWFCFHSEIHSFLFSAPEFEYFTPMVVWCFERKQSVIFGVSRVIMELILWLARGRVKSIMGVISVIGIIPVSSINLAVDTGPGITPPPCQCQCQGAGHHQCHAVTRW